MAYEEMWQLEGLFCDILGILVILENKVDDSLRNEFWSTQSSLEYGQQCEALSWIDLKYWHPSNGNVQW